MLRCSLRDFPRRHNLMDSSHPPSNNPFPPHTCSQGASPGGGEGPCTTPHGTELLPATGTAALDYRDLRQDAPRTVPRCRYLDAMHDIELLRFTQHHGRHAASRLALFCFRLSAPFRFRSPLPAPPPLLATAATTPSESARERDARRGRAPRLRNCSPPTRPRRESDLVALSAVAAISPRGLLFFLGEGRVCGR